MNNALHRNSLPKVNLQAARDGTALRGAGAFHLPLQRLSAAA